MKNFILELKDMCSASNTESRGFYIMVVAVLVLLLVSVISGLVATAIYAGAGNFQMLPLIVSIVSLVVFIGLVLWLHKS